MWIFLPRDRESWTMESISASLILWYWGCAQARFCTLCGGFVKRVCGYSFFHFIFFPSFFTLARRLSQLLQCCCCCLLCFFLFPHAFFQANCKVRIQVFILCVHNIPFAQAFTKKNHKNKIRTTWKGLRAWLAKKKKRKGVGGCNWACKRYNGRGKNGLRWEGR